MYLAEAQNRLQSGRLRPYKLKIGPAETKDKRYSLLTFLAHLDLAENNRLRANVIKLFRHYFTNFPNKLECLLD